MSILHLFFYLYMREKIGKMINFLMKGVFKMRQKPMQIVCTGFADSIRSTVNQQCT